MFCCTQSLVLVVFVVLCPKNTIRLTVNFLSMSKLCTQHKIVCTNFRKFLTFRVIKKNRKQGLESTSKVSTDPSQNMEPVFENFVQEAKKIFFS